MIDFSRYSRLTLAASLLMLCSCGHSEEAVVHLGSLTVQTGEADISGMPVRYACRLSELLPANISPPDLAGHQLFLVDDSGRDAMIAAEWDAATPFPWEDNDRGALVWIMDERSEEAKTRTFDLVTKRGGELPSPFSVEDRPGTYLRVRRGGKKLLQYNHGVVRQKEGEVGSYDRAAYIHPLWTPKGNVVTGDFSPEHIHQRGIFLAFRRVTFDELETEFWGLGETLGRILPDKIEPRYETGPVLAKLTFHNIGVVSGRTYFREVWGIRVYELAGNDYYLFDIVVKQIPVDPEAPGSQPGVPKTMELGQLHYGGMSFRGPSNWLRRDGRDVTRALAEGIEFPGVEWLPPEVELDVLTSEGKTREDGNETRARWVDYTGPLGDSWGGVTMFCHPENPAHPTPLRIHPELPYLSYALTQNGPVTVTSEKPLVQQFRVLAHDGRPDRQLNELHGSHYLDPPMITFAR